MSDTYFLLNRCLTRKRTMDYAFNIDLLYECITVKMEYLQLYTGDWVYI